MSNLWYTQHIGSKPFESGRYQTMKYSLFLGVAVLTSALAFGQEFKVGAPVDNFTLTDVSGKQVNYFDLRGDLTLVMFIATQCPISNAYNERMNVLYKDYAAKGVKFVAINSNSTEPASEVETHKAKHGFPFAVYKDGNNVVADRFGAQVTPEVFLIDAAGVIRYHGAIDDSQNPVNIKSQGLRLALDAALTRQPIQKAETKAFGCTIKRAKTTS